MSGLFAKTERTDQWNTGHGSPSMTQPGKHAVRELRSVVCALAPKIYYPGNFPIRQEPQTFRPIRGELSTAHGSPTM